VKSRSETVELAEVVAESVDRFRRQSPDTPINISISERAALARADPIFLDRILSNLLDNAVKAAVKAADRGIQVEARSSAEVITVRVIDHGAGVGQVAREQLFYPFYRLNERNPRLGSGLGLAICKGFVTLMGGEIWIEGTPGGGATLAFTLPSAVRTGRSTSYEEAPGGRDGSPARAGVSPGTDT
jgi:two-component system sensor histidine kinase KdpD